jgi:hypothetical protein
MFVAIMILFAIISTVLLPILFYLVHPTLKDAGYGYIAGSVWCIFLWLGAGQHLIN